MQVPTSLFYDDSARRMSGLNARAGVLQVQNATGKKLSRPSDDAVASQQLATFRQRGADAKVYGANMNAASALLRQTDSTLGAITDQLQGAIELASRAANGTLTGDARRVIGAELTAIVDQLVDLGNTTDLRGQPLFGSAAGTQPVQRAADGSFSFVSTAVSPIPIGEGQAIQATETAARVFGSNGGDVLTTLATLAAALEAGTATTDDAAGVLGELFAAADQIGVVQSSVGARGARVELSQAMLVETDTDREELRSSLEDADRIAVITELQETMTILNATQASFAKLSSLSLFNYLR